MENTKVTKTHKYANLFLAEFRNEISPGKIAGMIIGGLFFPILISYIGLFISGTMYMYQFEPLLIAAISTYVFARVIGSVREKATVDKNKAAFLYYNKNAIVATKLLLESFMFIIGYMVLVSVGAIGIFAHETQVTASDFLDASFAPLPGFLFLYLFIYSIGKWMISFIPKKGAAIAAAFFFALVMLTPIYILNQIQDTSLLSVAINRGGFSKSSSWFAENQNVAIWLPYFNIGSITGVHDIQLPLDTKGAIITGSSSANFSGRYMPVEQLDHSWYVIIPIFMMIGSVAITFPLQSSAQKRFLSAS